MIRLHELYASGKSIREIARTTGHARNTVRKYLRVNGIPESRSRKKEVPSSTLLSLSWINKWLREICDQEQRRCVMRPLDDFCLVCLGNDLGMASRRA